jgi:tubulin polyglutamylase TTLL9
MIDSNFKPWLIEINGSPSMSANTHKDSELKKGLLDDVFTILNMEGILMGD